MNLARVIGLATSTVKHSSLKGWRLLVVQPLDALGEADGDPLLAVDSLGGGRGDLVMITSDGTFVRELMRTDKTPARWAVLGMTD